MAKGQPIARVGDKTSHGGTIITGHPIVNVNGKPKARVGDKVTCPKCSGGPHVITTGVEEVAGSGQLVATIGSEVSCGAVIVEGSPDTYAAVPESITTEQRYKNQCWICEKNVDAEPLQDRLYNVLTISSEAEPYCDKNWIRKLRRFIDIGVHDIDILWQKMCIWHVDHNSVWKSHESFFEITVAFYIILGRSYNSLSGEDKVRRTKVKANLGLHRFGGRGELAYPNIDKVQHFLTGAVFGSWQGARIIGDIGEWKDAAVRRLPPPFKKPHHVGYDLHDYEWTWAGGAFTEKVTSFSDAGAENILQKFADGELVLSEIYTSVARNKDGDPIYRDNPNIDHAEKNVPDRSTKNFYDFLIDIEIYRMEALLERASK